MKKFYLCILMISIYLPLHAQVTIGSDLKPNIGALLDLKQFNVSDPQSDGHSNSKLGFNLPRVALQSASQLEPCATTNTTNKDSHMGLVVYNTTSNNELTPGIYYWNNQTWIRMVTELPQSTLNLKNLEASSTTVYGSSVGEGGSDLNFGSLIIPEDGSYAFNFRLYGSIADITVSPTRIYYYISVWVGNELKDIAEINIYSYTGTNRYTYSVALGATFTAGQNITFKMSHGVNNDVYAWTLIASSPTSAARTSMIWWKL